MSLNNQENRNFEDDEKLKEGQELLNFAKSNATVVTGKTANKNSAQPYKLAVYYPKKPDEYGSSENNANVTGKSFQRWKVINGVCIIWLHKH